MASEEEKRFIVIPIVPYIVVAWKTLEEYLSKGYKIIRCFNRVSDQNGLETTIIILEKPEPETEEKITAVKSVPLNEVNEYLNIGYEVHELFSKNAVLVKKETTEK